MSRVSKIIVVGLATAIFGASLTSAAVDPVAVLKKQITKLQATVKKMTETNASLVKQNSQLKTQLATKEGEIASLKETNRDLLSRISKVDIALPSSNGTSTFVSKLTIGTEQIVRIPANPAKGFNYPYYLWIPPDVKQDTYVMVESNNTGSPSDILDFHEESVKKNQLRGQTGGQLSGMLHIPMLMPVFPRPMSQGMVYTHDLDRDTLLIDSGDMKRLDLQLVAMIQDAQRLFNDNGVKVKDKVLMTGFSASAKFATKFAALHPEMVHALSAGGVNGVSVLPLSEFKGKSLRYPVGVADLQVLTGKAFDLEGFKQVRQFIFMGEQDTNDMTMYRDGFDEVDAQLTWDVLGKDMVGVRWPAYQKVLKDAGASVQFHTYSAIGHQITNVTVSDQAEFFRVNMGNRFKTITPSVSGL